MPEILKRLMSLGFESQRCADCDELITSEAINIKEGFALCPKCGKLSRLSELNTSGRTTAQILAQPPAGCSFFSDGKQAIATVSLRSLAGFVFPAGFALFWNGIVSVFVLLALAGLYANLVGPLPNWFPVPGLKDGKPEMNDQPMDLRETFFLCIFLIPFVLVGIVMPCVALMNLFGKVEVVIDEFDSYVATRFAFFRRKKRFNAREVKAVEFANTPWQSDGGSNKRIEIRANRLIKFGSMLQLDRAEWLRAVLRQTLLLHNDDNRPLTHPRLAWLSRKPQ